jgi:membrane protease subunit HflC
MNRPAFGFGVVVALALVALIVRLSIFTVDPTEQALVLRFGQPVGDIINAPGLHFKAPFIDNVVYIDRRILALNNDRQEVLVAENQRLEVDAFVRYRIVDPLLFYQSVGSVGGADAQLGGMLNSALRRTLSVASILDIVRYKRDELMADIRDEMHKGAARYGLDIIDVRIKRADLPEENSEAVFRRMQAERQQAAALFRAEGAKQAQQIRADADRDATVTRATARQKSEQLRGEGDGERNRIFAAAFGADPDFFAFYRSMQAYENALPSARAVIGPTSDFFRYFQSPTPAEPKTAGEAIKAASQSPKPASPSPQATSEPAKPEAPKPEAPAATPQAK